VHEREAQIELILMHPRRSELAGREPRIVHMRVQCRGVLRAVRSPATSRRLHGRYELRDGEGRSESAWQPVP
jgi:hypothetical protein